METLQLIFSTVGVVVSGASMIVAGLDVVAKITPSDKDDKALDAARRGGSGSQARPRCRVICA